MQGSRQPVELQAADLAPTPVNVKNRSSVLFSVYNLVLNVNPKGEKFKSLVSSCTGSSGGQTKHYQCQPDFCVCTIKVQTVKRTSVVSLRNWVTNQTWTQACCVQDGIRASLTLLHLTIFVPAKMNWGNRLFLSGLASLGLAIQLLKYSAGPEATGVWKATAGRVQIMWNSSLLYIFLRSYFLLHFRYPADVWSWAMLPVSAFE